jgi:creatinine amidohydrolase
MLWHEQSWKQIQALDKQLPVVVPIGSLEQHGHHLPLFVDSLQVAAVAEKVEKMMPDRVLLLPTFWLGSSHHHLDYPGTITVPPSLYSENIKWIARCILKAGFRRIFFLNGHGGNETPAAQALTELADEDDTADGAQLAFASWWGVGRQAIKPEKLGLETEFISHADEYETSFILALRPDLVRLAEAREGPPAIDNAWANTDYPYRSRVGVFHRMHRLTASGSMGKPSAATAEKGRAILNAVAEDVAAFLRDFATWKEFKVLKPAEGKRG